MPRRTVSSGWRGFLWLSRCYRQPCLSLSSVQWSGRLRPLRWGEWPDMHRPRPVALTGAERRVLRVIEEALTEEDPGLSVLLSELEEAYRPERRVRRATWIYVAVSVLVLVLGL